MTLTEVVNEVLRITARPDKRVDAISAVNKVISLVCLRGEFADDTAEATLTINSTLTADTIALTTLVRFRRFIYIKPTSKRYYLTKIAADQVFTPKNQIQPNRYFIAGSNLTYTLSELNTSLEVSYLQYPPVLDEVTLPNHWTLDKIPYSIIDLAAAKVYRQIGDDASADRYEVSGMQLFNTYSNDLKQP